MNQVSALPTRKVGSGALAGAVTTIVLWVITATTGVDVPAEVAAAITFILMFAASYFVQEAPTILDEPGTTPNHSVTPPKDEPPMEDTEPPGAPG